MGGAALVVNQMAFGAGPMFGEQLGSSALDRIAPSCELLTMSVAAVDLARHHPGVTAATTG